MSQQACAKCGKPFRPTDRRFKIGDLEFCGWCRADQTHSPPPVPPNPPPDVPAIPQDVERCRKCGREIPATSQAFVWENQPVCGACLVDAEAAKAKLDESLRRGADRVHSVPGVTEVYYAFAWVAARTLIGFGIVVALISVVVAFVATFGGPHQSGDSNFAAGSAIFVSGVFPGALVTSAGYVVFFLRRITIAVEKQEVKRGS